jgi:uncharacterized phage protein (TIGR02220 family)
VRARNIKPGFFKNEELAECDPLARILFAGLWCMADREGRLEDRPKRIKAEILPYDNCNIDKLLSQLETHQFINRYSVGDRKYINIPAFKQHQHIHIKELESLIPAPGQSGARTDQDINGTDPKRLKALIPILKAESVPSGTLSGNGEDAAPDTAPLERIPYAEIIGYLNQKTGKSFDPRSKETRKHIHARWNSGFRVDQFKKVIDRKAEVWGIDPKMVDYLRPQTLFGTKFEAYLNESSTAPSGEDWATRKERELAAKGITIVP